MTSKGEKLQDLVLISISIAQIQELEKQLKELKESKEVAARKTKKIARS